TDKAGKAVFGMDAKGPTAKPEEVEDYLRGMGAQDWGASLDVAVLPRKRKPTKQREAANDREPAPKPPAPPKPPKPPRPPKPAKLPKPSPEPVLTIRDAKPGDAADLAKLMKLLEHDIDAKGVRKRLAL